MSDPYRMNARVIAPLAPHLQPRITRMAKWTARDSSVSLEWSADARTMLRVWDKTGTPQHIVAMDLDAVRTLHAALVAVLEEIDPRLANPKPKADPYERRMPQATPKGDE